MTPLIVVALMIGYILCGMVVARIVFHFSPYIPERDGISGLVVYILGWPVVTLFFGAIGLLGLLAWGATGDNPFKD